MEELRINYYVQDSFGGGPWRDTQNTGWDTFEGAEKHMSLIVEERGGGTNAHYRIVRRVIINEVVFSTVAQ